MNDPAVADDAVQRKRMREAMKTTSGDEDFCSSVNEQIGEDAIDTTTDLEEKNGVLSSID
jgi:hypothetical protein